MRNIPIRRKLMMVGLLTSSTVLLVTCVAFFTYEFFIIHKNLRITYETRAHIIAANSTGSLAFQNAADATEVLSALHSDPWIAEACIYDNSTNIFARFPTNTPDADLPSLIGTSGYRNGFLETFAPVVQDRRHLGTVYFKTNLSALTSRYRAYAVLSVVIFSGSILLAYFISRFLQKQISTPILSLADTANAISRKRDFSVRAEKFGNDELGSLTDAFNQMLAEIHKLNSTLEQRVQERTVQLEVANKELEAFSYSVSHDLRAPLRHIDGYVRIFREDYGKTLPEDARRYLEVISAAARRMGNLIDDLLVFSRMGRSELRRSPVDTNSLVQEVLRDLAPETRDRSIDWDIGLLPEVNGDAAMLKQVWVNLISNAVKYSRGRAPAKIRIRCRENDTNEFEFSVQDNGAGFDMQYANKLFGVFQRLHQNEEFEGTGIGLANVRRIVMRHHGRTWAEGEIDKGATMYFTLPR